MARILVLDDDGASRDFARLILARAGHDVLEADDGRNARRMVRKHDVNVVITDIYMPGADGLEVILALREEHCACRILAVSGGGSRRDLGMLDYARKFGADAALAKPLPAARLNDSVNSLLAMGPWEDRADA